MRSTSYCASKVGDLSIARALTPRREFEHPIPIYSNGSSVGPLIQIINRVQCEVQGIQSKRHQNRGCSAGTGEKPPMSPYKVHRHHLYRQVPAYIHAKHSVRLKSGAERHNLCVNHNAVQLLASVFAYTSCSPHLSRLLTSHPGHRGWNDYRFTSTPLRLSHSKDR